MKRSFLSLSLLALLSIAMLTSVSAKTPHASKAGKTVTIDGQPFEVIELTVPKGSWGPGGLTKWLEYQVGIGQMKFYQSTSVEIDATGVQSTLMDLYEQFLTKINPGIDIHHVVPGQKVLVLRPQSLEKFIELMIALTKDNADLSSENFVLTKENEQLLSDNKTLLDATSAAVSKIQLLNEKMDSLKFACGINSLAAFLANGDFVVMNGVEQKFSGTMGYYDSYGDAFVGSFSSGNTLTGTEGFNQGFIYLRTPFMRMVNLSLAAHDAVMTDNQDRDYFELPGINLWMDASPGLFHSEYKDKSGNTLQSNHYFGLGYRMTWEGRENTFINALPAATSGYYAYNVHLKKNPFGRQFTFLLGGTLYNGYDNDKYNYFIALSSYQAQTVINNYHISTSGLTLLNTFAMPANDGFYLSFTQNAFGTSKEDVRYMLAENGGNYYSSCGEVAGFVRVRGVGIGFETVLNGKNKSLASKYFRINAYSPLFLHDAISLSAGYGKIGTEDIITFTINFHNFFTLNDDQK